MEERTARQEFREDLDEHWFAATDLEDRRVFYSILMTLYLDFAHRLLVKLGMDAPVSFTGVFRKLQDFVEAFVFSDEEFRGVIWEQSSTLKLRDQIIEMMDATHETPNEASFIQVVVTILDRHPKINRVLPSFESIINASTTSRDSELRVQEWTWLARRLQLLFGLYHRFGPVSFYDRDKLSGENASVHWAVEDDKPQLSVVLHQAWVRNKKDLPTYVRIMLIVMMNYVERCVLARPDLFEQYKPIVRMTFKQAREYFDTDELSRLKKERRLLEISNPLDEYMQEDYLSPETFMNNAFIELLKDISDAAISPWGARERFEDFTYAIVPKRRTTAPYFRSLEEEETQGEIDWLARRIQFVSEAYRRAGQRTWDVLKSGTYPTPQNVWISAGLERFEVTERVENPSRSRPLKRRRR